jgi:glutathione synthase/RimK-type ligase-like ATP-grasp enzyme
MNNICVVAKNKETYFIKKLMNTLGHSLQVFDPWSDFMVPEADFYITRTTGVYGSDLDLLMLNHLPKHKLINSLDVLKRFRSKPIQYSWFEQQDIPILPWLSLKNCDLITVEKFFRLYPEVIVKPSIGQGGWGVEALRWSDFKAWKKKKGNDTDYLMQPYLKGASEFRYFFMKGLSPIVLHRSVKTGVAANFRKQGEAIVSSLPEKFSPLMKDLVSKSQAFYGAIDLLVQDERPYVLELNSVPGIEQLEKVSGREVIQELVNGLTG